ncbi:MAG: PD-(D/E)XK nuclease family protein [Halothiobacillus sp.]|jgi:hypothetical protein|nr:PD-(D/E)XK nuclease family protein [Halothiobacillus sp.]MDY0146537.1 PD-(D/E)XK nuclease family protein [Halothiobacillus sp.]
MILRPSDVLGYEQCPQQQLLKKTWRPASTSINFGFGKAFHDGAEAIAIHSITGEQKSAIEVFDAKWAIESIKPGVIYKEGHTPKTLQDLGHACLGAFETLWQETGLMPWFTPDGNPLVEKRLSADIGGGLILTTQPDLVCMDGDGQISTDDIKTARAASAEYFGEIADQLTCQQVVLDANAEELGFHQVDLMSFLEVTKQKKPKAARLKGHRRTNKQVREYLEKVKRIADDMNNGYFPKRSLMAFNSPCGLCDFKDLCHRGITEGLVEIASTKEGSSDQVAA